MVNTWFEDGAEKGGTVNVFHLGAAGAVWAAKAKGFGAN